MKKLRGIILILLFSFIYIFCNAKSVSANEIVGYNTYNDILGNALGSIQIYDDGEIVIGYKYGLRRVDLYYCTKGEDCDNNFYSIKIIQESSFDEPYKNDSDELAIFTYNLDLDESLEYKIRVEAYFGTNSRYTGTESIRGSFTISSVQSADTGGNYISVSSSSSNTGNKNLDNLLEKIKKIINEAVIPIIYVALGLILIIKGILLGIQIVKSADEPYIRQEKISSLKWLVIGVAIAFAASSLVGVITGFFKDVFK